MAPSAAEDLAAETWLSVIRGLGDFAGDKHAFRTWEFTLARQRAIGWRRRAPGPPAQLVPRRPATDRLAPELATDVLEGLQASLALIAELPRPRPT